MKDEVNAGNLLYKLGKVEFENVYFSYINGLVHVCNVDEVRGSPVDEERIFPTQLLISTETCPVSCLGSLAMSMCHKLITQM